MLEGSEDIFDIPVTDFIDIIRCEVGDEVTVEYRKGDETNTVLSLNGKEKPAAGEAQTADNDFS